jgi:hypothetical protein
VIERQPATTTQEKPRGAPKDPCSMQAASSAPPRRRPGSRALVALLIGVLGVPVAMVRAWAPSPAETVSLIGGTPPTTAVTVDIAPSETPVMAGAGVAPASSRIGTRSARAQTRRTVLAPAQTPTTVTWPARVGAETIGVNAQFLFDMAPESRVPHFQQMHAAGISVVRRDANWNEIEPHPPGLFGAHQYDWRRYDEWAMGLAQAGLRWQITLGYSAVWASSRPSDKPEAQFYPPARTADFTAYATAVARRYGQGGEFWRANPQLTARPVTTYEVWNEQNESHWWQPQPDPVAYADLYLASRAAVVAVDPSASVVVGGLSTQLTSTKAAIAAKDFVAQMYGARGELRSVVPAIGYHSYPHSSQSPAEDVVQNVVDFRAGVNAVHPGVPILLNEYGWSTQGTAGDAIPTVSESERANAIATATDRLARSNCGVVQLMIHTWVGFEDTPYPPIPLDSPERWYGIYNRDATPKPSGAAYAATIQRLLGRGPGPPDPATVDLC